MKQKLFRTALVIVLLAVCIPLGVLAASVTTNLNDVTELSMKKGDKVEFDGVITAIYKKEITVTVPYVVKNASGDNIIKTRVVTVSGNDKASKNKIKELYKNADVYKDYSATFVGTVKKPNDLLIECNMIPSPEDRNVWKDMYRKYSKTYSYDDIRKNLTEKAAVKVTVTVDKVMDGYFIAYDDDYNGYYIDDALNFKNSKTVMDKDKIVVYGRFDGNETSTNGKVTPYIYPFACDFK